MRHAAQKLVAACALLLSFALLASCGQRGPLTLPAGSKGGTVAPAAPPAPAQTPPPQSQPAPTPAP